MITLFLFMVLLLLEHLFVDLMRCCFCQIVISFMWWDIMMFLSDCYFFRWWDGTGRKSLAKLERRWWPWAGGKKEQNGSDFYVQLFIFSHKNIFGRPLLSTFYLFLKKNHHWHLCSGKDWHLPPLTPHPWRWRTVYVLIFSRWFASFPQILFKQINHCDPLSTSGWWCRDLRILKDSILANPNSS